MKERDGGWWQRMGGTAGIALGGAPLGNLYAPVDEDAAERTVRRAWELGVRYFDTAPHYGQGLSEQRFGRALRSYARDDYLLSTKVGRLLTADAQAPRDQFGYVQALPYTARFDYSADGALRSIEDSLKRLNLSRIDIAYIHDIDTRTHGAEQPARFREAMQGAYRALERLRGEGVIRAVGLGVNEWEVCRDALAHGDFDCFMLAGRYTLLDQSAAPELMPACRARGVRLVLAGAYNSGILATGAVAGARFDYQAADADTLQRVRRIEAVCRSFAVPLRAAALQFLRGAPCLATAVVGGRSPEEIEDSVRMAQHLVPAEFWAALRNEGLLAESLAEPLRTGAQVVV
jgi:D-threo-aldose 1-dehydrogenase